MRGFARTLEQGLDVVGRADTARRTHKLGANLFSGSHSSLVAFLDDAGLSMALEAPDLDPASGFASTGFASGLAGVSLFGAGSVALPLDSAAGAVCGFLPSLP